MASSGLSENVILTKIILNTDGTIGYMETYGAMGRVGVLEAPDVGTYLPELLM